MTLSSKTEPEGEYAEFAHSKGKIFRDFSEVKAEIIAETERTVGKNKGISNEPISLKICSPHLVTLTLVDLPGLTKIPIGEQPPDIEHQIRKMVMEYISNPAAIILAISAANQDLANSEALKIAQEVDPSGSRTIGVLSKIDLMDKGTDAMDILLGKIFPLKLGYIGIVNRSQQDIMDNVPIEESLQRERLFFRQHPLYRNIAHRLGVAYLTRSLSVILVNHIKDCLPELRHKISGSILEIEAQLSTYGEEADQSLKGAMILQMFGKFVSNFKDALDGKLQDVYGGKLTELYGGSRISYTFHELFARAVESIDPFTCLSDEDIRTALRNATGSRPSLFVPEIAFDLLVKKQIIRLEEPALQCCDLIFDELLSIANQCDAPEFSRYEFLREKIIEQVHTLIRKRLGPTKQMVSNLIEIELAYVNTNHPDFIGGTNAISLLTEKEEEKLQLEPLDKRQSNSFFSILNSQPKDDKHTPHKESEYSHAMLRQLVGMRLTCFFV